MLRMASQGLAGTPRHRRPAALPWPSDGHPGRDIGKRRRITRRLVVMAAGLICIAMLSFSTFTRDSHTTTAEQGDTITPGKRHRKLEHRSKSTSAAKEQQQLSLLVEQQDARDSSTQALQQQQQGDALSGGGSSELGAAQLRAQAAAEEEQDYGDLDQDEEAHADDAQLQQQQHVGERLEGLAAAGATAGLASEGMHGLAAAAVAGEGEQDEGVEEEEEAAGSSHKRKRSPYYLALEKCDDLKCVSQAAALPRYPGQFLFPHFIILGWQKCATTSLFHHLKDHPRVITPSEKEPEFFSYDCEYDPLACPAEMQREYVTQTLHLSRVLKHNLHRAAFEGSTHYAREGARLAKGLYQVFPWVKLIASMREPISRYLSMLGHNLDKNTYTCLVKRDLFECLELELPWNNYTTPITTWLEAYPREQIMLLQYESLTDPEKEADHLRSVKNFLGLDPELPANELGSHNTRAERLGQEPEGWPMQRWQYAKLVEIVRPDAERMADVVTTYGLGDGQQWLRNWEAVWHATLNSCDAEGSCIVH